MDAHTLSPIRQAILAAVLLAFVAACSSGDPKETTSPSPSVDPAANPSIDKSLAVAPDGRKERTLWCARGKGRPTVLLSETRGSQTLRNGRARTSCMNSHRSRGCAPTTAPEQARATPPAPNKKRTADDVVREADALLTAAGLDGPLVLLGRSFGGMIVTHYAETLPADVVGVVILDTPAPSAEFTEKSEPELVWDHPGNTEHLDVVGGFENRFAKDPPQFDAPLLLITPAGGEADAKNESFWLQTSPDSRQVEGSCGDDGTDGPCATELVKFVKKVDTN